MRNRILFSAFISLFCSSLFSQIEELVQPLQQAYISKDFKVLSTICDTIGLPLEDDFSGREGATDSRRWCDSKVWINDSYGLDVPTLGVATFDGLDEFGQAYDILDNNSDTIADVLTSKYIRYVNNPQNVFLSFLYQVGGRGEKPTSGDFLTVQFWSPIDSNWTEVWRKEADSIVDFRNAIIPVDSNIWLEDGFQFRLAAYGARSGSFDIWNVDYVRLGANRSINDTVFTDAGFTRQHPSLLKDYWQIPWFHLDGLPDPFKDEYQLHYRKNGDTLSVSINLRRFALRYDGTVIQSKGGIPWNNFSYNKEHTVPVPIDPILLNPAPTGPFQLQISSIMDGANDGFRSNDTVVGTHSFDNYYAFDDGSAERVYGLSNVAGAITAVNLTPLKPDSLKGLYIYFGQAKVDAKNNSFQIGIWENVNGLPGDLIYLSDSSFTPEYFNTNQFSAFPLDTSAIYLDRSVFIGLKQRTVNPLNIGLDVNRPDGDTLTTIFYNDGVNWYQSLFGGNLLLRPYFNYQPVDLSSGADEKINGDLVLFPNPASSEFTIHWNGHDEYDLKVTDMLGRFKMQLQNWSSSSISVDNWSSGIYFILLEDRSTGESQYAKLIVN
jgi:hypothetical protein